jgi:calcineurin-like phosphoesterase family protein
MNIFFISDTHYGHEAPCTKFLRADGSKLRNFSCAAECDQYQEEQWNKTVSPKDKVYHLGDISMGNKHLDILDRLNGEKVLIKGNHDTQTLSRYAKFFKDVRGSHQFDGLLLTHIPIHPDSLARWGFNVHGHTHANRVMTAFGAKIDPRYFCVSVECIDYTPISLEEVKKHKPDLELKPRS